MRLQLNERQFRSDIRPLGVDTLHGNTHVDMIASKILALEERMESFATDAAKRYRHLKDSVRKIKTDIAVSKEERERDFEAKVGELLKVEKEFEDTIDNEKAVRLLDNPGAQNRGEQTV